MKCITVILVVLSLNCVRSYSPCTNWKSRMRKYGALVNCEYYITSENIYRDYFEFRPEYISNYTISTFSIFSLSQNVIKFQLSDADLGALPASSNNQYEFVIGESFECNENSSGSNGGNGSSGGNGENESFNGDPNGGANPKNYGDDNGTPNNPNSSSGSNGGENGGNGSNGVNPDNGGNGGNGNGNNGARTENCVVSYVQKGGQRLKTLATPGIIRTDQPNEILIELLIDNKIRIIINENTPIVVRAQNVTEIKHISFASAKNNNAEEFFYNCVPN